MSLAIALTITDALSNREGLRKTADVLPILQHRRKKIADTIQTFEDCANGEGVRIDRLTQFFPPKRS
jgi:hypothetical protein